jgi:hypothetical protein
MRVLVLFFFLFSSFARAEGIPPDVTDVTPDKYSCKRLKHPAWDAEEKFTISRSNGYYLLEFERTRGPSVGSESSLLKKQRLKPGTLAAYLTPLGVDDRIIANYFEWELAPIKIPVNSCTAKTFGSLFAEELDCKAKEIEVNITAKYKTSSGKEAEDIYTIKNAELKLGTKVISGMKGTYCLADYYDYDGINKSLVLNFALAFKGPDNKPAKVSDSIAFHPDCSDYEDSEGYGGNLNVHGHCGLSGGIRFGIGVADLIKLRQ